MAVEVKLGKPLVLQAAVPAMGTAPEVAAVALEVVKLDFDKLTGNDVLMADALSLIARGGQPTVELRVDTSFQLQMAARACGHEVEILQRLGAADFLDIMAAVRRFLLGSD